MILITGANGQLGTELRHLLDERNEEYVAVDVAEMDITNAEKVDEVFAEVKPTLVYHCAAYTAVDAAEDEGKELDYAINLILKQSTVVPNVWGKNWLRSMCLTSILSVQLGSLETTVRTLSSPCKILRRLTKHLQSSTTNMVVQPGHVLSQSL